MAAQGTQALMALKNVIILNATVVVVDLDFAKAAGGQYSTVSHDEQLISFHVCCVCKPPTRLMPVTWSSQGGSVVILR